MISRDIPLVLGILVELGFRWLFCKLPNTLKLKLIFEFALLFKLVFKFEFKLELDVLDCSYDNLFELNFAY